MLDGLGYPYTMLDPHLALHCYNTSPSPRVSLLRMTHKAYISIRMNIIEIFCGKFLQIQLIDLFVILYKIALSE